VKLSCVAPALSGDPAPIGGMSGCWTVMRGNLEGLEARTAAQLRRPEGYSGLK
jgi:hypothetical protein